MKNNHYFLVSSEVLPPVFEGVVTAKELLANGKAANTSAAIKLAGISRSAFYKYKDFVFKYTENNENTVNLSALLSDKAGVFSALTTALYQNGANIITVNQSLPVDGTAAVAMTIRTDTMTQPVEQLIILLSEVDGVILIKRV